MSWIAKAKDSITDISATVTDRNVHTASCNYRKCGRIAVIGKVKQVVTIASLINAISGGVYFSQYEEDEA